MPVQNVNINNVSMDYFLRGVEAAKPKNAPQVPQEAQAGANAVAAPELEAAGKMVSQLDVLLMKAAKTADTAAMTLKALSVVDMIYHLYARLTTRLTPDLKPLRYEKHAEEGSRVYDETIEFSTPAEGGCKVSAIGEDSEWRLFA